MIDSNPPTHRRRGSRALRRLTLLASAACLGAALAAAGSGGFDLRDFPGWTSPAQAADANLAHPAKLAHPTNFANLVAKVKPAVVSVRVTFKRSPDLASMTQSEGGSVPFAPNSPMQKFFRQFGFHNLPNDSSPPHAILIGEGSGFFISPDGYVVTNDHVVAGAKSIQVTTSDGTVHAAKVVGADKKTDLALIKVEGGKDFPYVKLADHRPRVGDWVVAVGNPYGLGGTVTAGIVSAEGRTVGVNPYDDYMQIDAPINKGNSGGPTFNMKGHVVGVNTAIYTPSGGSVGIGFDIPAKTVKMVVSQLKAKGYVSHGWMGVKIQSVTREIADSLGMKSASGVLVDQAEPGSPAAKVGLASGDVITAVNGAPVRNARDLARTVGMMAPSTKIELKVLRNGASKTMAVRLGRMPNERMAEAGNGSVPRLGLAVEPARDVSGSGDKGVVITSVSPTSAAARQGLRKGDVILDAAGSPVDGAPGLRHDVAEAKKQGRQDLLIRVKTAKGTFFVAEPIRRG